MNIEDATKKNYFLLFPEEMILSILDAFIINQPMTGKSGGDGFFVHQTKDCLYICLYDCMGHGHLASIMTRIYNHFLEEIIIKEGLIDPGEILNNLHKKVQEKFKDKRNQLVGTAADAAIVKIDQNVRQMEFAGAKINLVHVIKREATVIKGQRIQVGDFYEYARDYKSQKIIFPEGMKSSFYLMTDGFKDLIGTSKEKKLGIRKIITFLETNYLNPSPKTKENMLTLIDDWGGGNDRVDDLLVIGFSV